MFHNFRGGTVSVLRRWGAWAQGAEGLTAAQKGPWERGNTAWPGTTTPTPPFPLSQHTHSHTKLFRASAHLTNVLAPAAAVLKSLLRRKLHGLNLRPAISLLSWALLL